MYSVLTYTTQGPVRDSNQDNFWVGESLDRGGTPFITAVLADGMGGLTKGDEASKDLCKSIRNAVIEGKISEQELTQEIQKINDRYYTQYKNTGERSGTTVTLIQVNLETGDYIVLHAGDSRGYLLKQSGAKHQLTEDHTAYNKYIKEGKDLSTMSRLEILKATSKLTRCVGATELFSLDKNKGVLDEGDKILLASDGFWHGINGAIREENMRKIMDWDGEENSGVLRELSDQFIDEKETDNQTAVLIKINKLGNR